MQYRKVNTSTNKEGHPNFHLATLPREVAVTTHELCDREGLSEPSELDQC